jgi:hypothetical protein
VFDDIAAQFDDFDAAGVVKIDVEGAELEVLSGMRRYLSRCRPLVICEVLPPFGPGKVGVAHERHARLAALLGEAGYAPSRIVKDEAQRAVAGLTPVAAFPDQVLDARTSTRTRQSDYLFVPRERTSEVEQAFGRARDSHALKPGHFQRPFIQTQSLPWKDQ